MPYSPALPFAHWAGPRKPKVLFIGEAWGREEFEVRKPFVGSSGKELFRMLGEANPMLAPELHAEISQLLNYGLAWTKRREEWFEQAGFAFTNVLQFRPPENSLLELCVEKKAIQDPTYTHSALLKGRYLRPEFLGELDRLWTEIAAADPNLIVLLGNTACWAVLGTTAISSLRGTVAPARADRASQSGARPFGWKCLPTYHPAGVLYNWAWRPIVLADLGKAALESRSPNIVRPARRVKIFPTLEECRAFLAAMQASPPDVMASDIETKQGQVTTISFGPSAETAFVIPFWDSRRPGWSYWPTPEEEREAWNIVEALLGLCPVVWQNGVYDMQYLTRMGIRVRSDEDTMLMHHSWLPEMQKGLGFLGSVYTSESSWKLMRKRRSTDVVKADE